MNLKGRDDNHRKSSTANLVSCRTSEEGSLGLLFRKFMQVPAICSCRYHPWSQLPAGLGYPLFCIHRSGNCGNFLLWMQVSVLRSRLPAGAGADNLQIHPWLSLE